MASRSFKPASYLASAAQGRSRSPRPSFTRTSSSSSTISEDSVFGLRGLSIAEEHMEKKKNNNNNNNNADSGSRSKSCKTKKNPIPGSPLGAASSSQRSSFFNDTNTSTPGRKASKPIAIELPGRDPRQVYTPLSARGDLPGGYFPNHEEITRSYTTHPFNSHKEQPSSDVEIPSEMPAIVLGSPVSSDVTPRASSNTMSSNFAPQTLMMPKGKYHPSNYKSQPSSAVGSPTAASTYAAPFPSNNLVIPKSLGKRNANGRPDHERKTSDVKRKIQQYQRDMTVQARLAGGSGPSMNTIGNKPTSPRLLPLGSPGQITPFELEESSGYLAVGSRSGAGILGIGAERLREREADIVNSIVRKEEERRSPPTTPTAKVL